MNTILLRVAKWLAKPERGFQAASEDERYVYGARRPGFPFSPVPPELVTSWISFMHAQSIRRVVCLLPERGLAAYPDLLDMYRTAFGAEHVCWLPIEDFHLADVNGLTLSLLPFLADSERQGLKTVVHCSGGIGRTGHVLATWLVSFRGMSNEEAIQTVRKSGRNARESRDKGLDVLLDCCREAFAR